MLNMDEENYKEAIESSYKVSLPHGISKLVIFSIESLTIMHACPCFDAFIVQIIEFIYNLDA